MARPKEKSNCGDIDKALIAGKDIEDLVQTFKCVRVLQDVKEADWLRQLIPLLSGQARAVYNDVDERVEYPLIKEAILKRFEVSFEVDHRKLCNLTWNSRTEPEEFGIHLKTLTKRWLFAAEFLSEDSKIVGTVKIVMQKVKWSGFEHLDEGVHYLDESSDTPECSQGDTVS